MSALPTPLYRASQVRALERMAIEDAGIELMERAGLAAWESLRSSWPRAGSLVVICGGGNNAGDGYILARHAMQENLGVAVLYMNEPSTLKGDANSAAASLQAAGGRLQPFSADTLASLVTDTGVIVDALLGTGIDRNVDGQYRQAIDAVNQSGKPVLAIDIPSGLNADSGRVMGMAVEADVTVTFIGLKQGLFTGEGAHYCGRILFSDLDVPAKIHDQLSPASYRIDLESLSSLLPKRMRSAHKGDFGHVLVIGADFGFLGAACMAGEASARIGAGLVTVATRPEHASGVTMVRPELMSRGIEGPLTLKPLLDNSTVAVIGPGLGRSDWAAGLLACALESQLPLVVDADALNLLAHEPARSDQWILTPHPGEAARLLASSTAEVQNDRYAAAMALQEKYGGVIVLKGSGTIIVDMEKRVAVCNAGNPGMATGGMGDVLTGVIAGLLAQGYTPGDAARLGVSLHAAAADAAAGEGERGMLATDLMPWIRRFANP